jgi:hypothetical protein
VPVPQHRGLALVGDADRLDVARGDLGLPQAVLRDLQLAAPDRLGVVLDVARLRVDLPSWPNRIARLEVVPWSSART